MLLYNIEVLCKRRKISGYFMSEFLLIAKHLNWKLIKEIFLGTTNENYHCQKKVGYLCSLCIAASILSCNSFNFWEFCYNIIVIIFWHGIYKYRSRYDAALSNEMSFNIILIWRLRRFLYVDIIISWLVIVVDLYSAFSEETLPVIYTCKPDYSAR